ncbi:curlin repeat-containing protein [Pseudomonas luteola]|uniref:curlin repeat-containing protein n=2 Tax=Pseudomonas TaxID=286 RepID=UPI00384E835B
MFKLTPLALIVLASFSSLVVAENNRATQTQSGFDNEASLEQRGDGNNATQEQLLADHQSSTVIQTGNNNDADVL